MNDNHDDDLVRRLDRLGAVTPTPEATNHAMGRVRLTLAANPVAEHPRRARHLLNRWAAIAAMLLAVAGLSFWLIPTISTGRAWADVQAAMKSAHSVTFRESGHAQGEPDKKPRKSFLLDNGLCRFEEGDGAYSIADFANSRQLYVDPQKRTAFLMQGMANMPPANLYEFVKNLPGHATARPLPGKNIDGRDVLGFAVKVNDQDAVVWADAKTRLPVRIEVEFKDKEGKKVAEETIDDFVFDKELDAKLFSFDPPAGFTLTTTGLAKLPAASDDTRLMKPLVTPLVGIGPVRFGTSIADVEKLLGKADSVKEVNKNGLTEISYGSRGYFIGAGKASGVIMITGVAQAAWGTKVRDFAGKTDKDIGMGASAADVIRAYGEPTSKETKEGSTYLNYNNYLQCHFTLFNDRLVSMAFSRPRPAK
jgi:hypothetical protein